LPLRSEPLVCGLISYWGAIHDQISNDPACSCILGDHIDLL
jgi:hypothetical protein